MDSQNIKSQISNKFQIQNPKFQTTVFVNQIAVMCVICKFG